MLATLTCVNSQQVYISSENICSSLYKVEANTGLISRAISKTNLRTFKLQGITGVEKYNNSKCSIYNFGSDIELKPSCSYSFVSKLSRGSDDKSINSVFEESHLSKLCHELIKGVCEICITYGNCMEGNLRQILANESWENTSTKRKVQHGFLLSWN